MAVGSAIGAVLAARVEMTAMPQLVAILHSFVGAAAVLVGLGGTLDPNAVHTGVEATIHQIEIFIGVFVGAITFTGSVIAFGKLQGVIRSKPLLLPGRHWLNLGMLLACLFFATQFVGQPTLLPLLWTTVIAGFLGVHLVMAIGGADMPVVVSMLNSYSGWAAAAAGFMLNNDLLIITGALVGSSGAILSYIMCRAMNRSFLSVIFGGFGADEGAAPAKSASGEPQGEVQERDRGRDRGDPPGRQERGDRARLRHGRGAGAVPALRGHQAAPRRAAPTCASPSTRWPAACPAT